MRTKLVIWALALMMAFVLARVVGASSELEHVGSWWIGRADDGRGCIAMSMSEDEGGAVAVIASPNHLVIAGRDHLILAVIVTNDKIGYSTLYYAFDDEEPVRAEWKVIATGLAIESNVLLERLKTAKTFTFVVKLVNDTEVLVKVPLTETTLALERLKACANTKVL